MPKKNFFESGQAAKIINMQERTLRYWATIKAISPAQDTSGIQGVRRQYSFENLVEGAILRELKKQGITISLGGKAVAQVREKNFGNGEFCLLQIIGGNKIDVIIEEDLNPDTRLYCNILGRFAKYRGKISELRYPIKSFFAEKKRESQMTPEEREEECKKVAKEHEEGGKEVNEEHEEMDKMRSMLWYSEIGLRIVNNNESTLMVPVHTLWQEMENKIK